MIKWHIEKRKLSELEPAPYNPRQATEKEKHDLTQSIDTFGLAEPLIINLNNRIIGGHFRFKILQEKKTEEVDVCVPERMLTEEEERELNLRLNKNSGDWDWDMLANFDEEMLINVGFNAQSLDVVFGLNEGKTAPDDAPDVPEQTNVKPGDIFELGEHRLMCGDSTSTADMAALMQKDGKPVLADMMFTDPPYNVNYAGKGKDTSEGIKNDNLPEEQFKEFISHLFENAYAAMREGAVFYICSGWSSYPCFNANLIQSGFYRAGVIIWVKNNASYGWNDYRYKHEWILVGKRKAERVKGVSILYGWKKGSHFFRDTRDEYDIWEVPREHSGNYKHPTQKPVYLVEKALVNSSERGWNVVDICAGLGCTLMGCERLKRVCYAMEYDPKYVDLIIQRWEAYTGQKAKKIGETATVALT
jgi:DNA modification methylase